MKKEKNNISLNSKCISSLFSDGKSTSNEYAKGKIVRK